MRKLLLPSYKARSNAAEALEQMASESGALTSADLALFSGHPAGSSPRRVSGRLGTALWEVFPGSAALLDRDGVIVSVNRFWRQFGLERGGSSTAEIGTNYLEVCDRARFEEPEAGEAAAMVRAALHGDWPDGRLEYPSGEEADGSSRWFALQAIPLPGRHSGALVLHLDVTSYVQREKIWQHRATHDPLTGLPNRTLVCDRLTSGIQQARHADLSLAVLFLDLDGFKEFNDQHGHEAGDEILLEVARRLRACAEGVETVGRWAGDEFVVVAPAAEREFPAGARPEDLAERIRTALRRPVHLPGETVDVSASIGIAHLDAKHRDANDLVHAADQALLEARLAAGRTARR